MNNNANKFILYLTIISSLISMVLIKECMTENISNRIPCTEEYNGYCLNGECFTIGGDENMKHCVCPKEFSGERCQIRDYA
nr:U18_MYRTX_Pc1b [Pogonomyrmex californicus]